MGPALEGVAQLLGTVRDELQGMMRIGNQVIFDNVFPKLAVLLSRARSGPVTGAAALKWDMDTLAEEQTLIQPLYASVSPATISALDNIARQQGVAGLGAWATNGARVAPGPHNRGGQMPEFGSGSPRSSITNVGDRWNYGMRVGAEFAPSPTGFAPGTPMPTVPESYTSGAELRTVDTRHNLHMLDACIDSPIQADPARVIGLLRALNPVEQEQFNTDLSPDGKQYSRQLADASFEIILLTGAMVERTAMTSSIPAIVGAYMGGLGPTRFLARYASQITSLRRTAHRTQLLPGFTFP